MAYIPPVYIWVQSPAEYDLAQREEKTRNRPKYAAQREAAQTARDEILTKAPLWSNLSLKPDTSTPNVTKPKDIHITHYRAKLAYGAVKPRSSGTGGAKPTASIARDNDRRNLTNYAAKSNH